jgi:hypothetical protein
MIKDAFIELNLRLIHFFYDNFTVSKWNGFNLLAVDGTTVQLPRIEAIAEHFGAWYPRQGDECPMARVSQMFDPINKITIDALIEPKSVGESLKLRLIRVELDSGEAEILITNLVNQHQYPVEQFAELYHLRWPVEEDYKTMKKWIEVENFTGKSVLSVYQDFHARVFSKNLTSALAFPVQSEIDENTGHCLYQYQRNFAQVLSKMKDVLPLLFVRARSKVLSIISDLHAIVRVASIIDGYRIQYGQAK